MGGCCVDGCCQCRDDEKACRRLKEHWVRYMRLTSSKNNCIEIKRTDSADYATKAKMSDQHQVQAYDLGRQKEHQHS